MLQIVVPQREYYNRSTNQFVYTKEQKLNLEHSLVSVSKWESKFCKPFLYTFDKSPTDEEIRYYVKCMTLTQNVDDNIYVSLTRENIDEIFEYINNSMTATTFRDEKHKPPRELVTSELVYYWMTQCNIPFECQKWHFNRLLTLIRVCNVKSQPPKKRSAAEIAERYRIENEKRKKEWNTKG